MSDAVDHDRAREIAEWQLWVGPLDDQFDAVCRAYLESQDERKMSEECIMLMRGHLETVGIRAGFADDAAALAAREIARLRDEHAALIERLREMSRLWDTEIQNHTDLKGWLGPLWAATLSRLRAALAEHDKGAGDE